MNVTNYTAQLLIRQAVRGNPVSMRVHEQAAAALQRVIDTRQPTTADGAPDLADLYRTACELAAFKRRPATFAMTHKSLRYRVVVTKQGRVDVCTWRGLPLTVGLAA